MVSVSDKGIVKWADEKHAGAAQLYKQQNAQGHSLPVCDL